MKRIIVACGSGVATSQTVASKVASLCEERGLNVEVEAVDIKSLEFYIKNSDLYISITPGAPDEYNVPTIGGIPFLTGIGINEVMDQVEEIIKS